MKPEMTIYIFIDQLNVIQLLCTELYQFYRSPFYYYNTLNIIVSSLCLTSFSAQHSFGAFSSPQEGGAENG